MRCHLKAIQQSNNPKGRKTIHWLGKISPTNSQVNKLKAINYNTLPMAAILIALAKIMFSHVFSHFLRFYEGDIYVYIRGKLTECYLVSVAELR